LWARTEVSSNDQSVATARFVTAVGDDARADGYQLCAGEHDRDPTDQPECPIGRVKRAIDGIDGDLVDRLGWAGRVGTAGRTGGRRSGDRSGRRSR
jgi:hypothetical protein